MNRQTLCLLLGVCHAGSAAALGLGELRLRSALGQPLHATVRILGVTDATEADCFSVRPSADSAVPPPLRPQLRLERRGDEALLHIRTPAPVSDPIAQFTLTSDCESRLQRDYVVLLDPPATSAPTPAVADAAPAPAARPPVRTNPPPSAAANSAERPARSTRSERPDARPRRVERSARAAAPEPAPRLVLSGRRGVSPGGLSLRLDTSLPDLNRPRPDALTPDELSDENTALTRKLAHLEAQLQDLARRNAELETRRGALPATPPPQATIDLPPRWPLYALIVALAIAGVVLVGRMLRRRATAVDDTAAGPADAGSEGDVDRMTEARWTTRPQASPRTPTEASGTRGDAKPEPVVDFGPAAAAETTEVNDDILDQAEVYMAHGHGDLAIHLLQEHLRAAPDESPVPWLLLLDLLHREGDTAGYAAASAECRRTFNINLGTHGAGGEPENGLGIEAYPHILEQLIRVWGSDEADAFFDDLIFDRRGGTRIGFEPGAYREILLLRAIAEAR